MDFPLISGDDGDWQKPLENLICPICQKNKIGEPHSMVILNGGYYLGPQYYGPARGKKQITQYWGAIWHGAHDTGEGPWRDLFIPINVVDDLTAIEHRLIFCSTDCLRQFFNLFVDEIDARIQREVKKEMGEAEDE